MPAVFIHGVPDTSDLWEPVLARLVRKDVVALRLPGFGEPVPDGFGCTKEEYAGWVVGQLEEIGDVVDLVGHDWGGLLTQRVATTKPGLVRTWTEIDATVSESFRWHDIAQQWQTPGVGEQLMDLMSSDAAVPALRDAGHPDPERAVAHIDDRMKAAVLALYRSALDIAAEWGPGLDDNTRPALVMWGAHDALGSAQHARRVAERLGGRFVELAAGHWAPFERPDEAVAALESFWADAPRP